ncbi:hypothetical protein AB6A40_005055 [Gnathostoma spinigerum]|uniref:RING-type domain-containing protein n=1 Tax=Gnathostoma spinigerum TaxID=75299 RepID=A0ABD6EGL5_9BILA
MHRPRLNMGNCLPLLFPSLVRHEEDNSVHDSASQSQHRSHVIANQSSYVNQLWASENDVVEENTETKEREAANRARLASMLDQIPADNYVEGTKADTECAICMVDFVNGDAIRYLPCMHCYHVKCVDDWLMRSFTCPSCMEPVDSAILSSFTAHLVTDLTSLSCSPATSGRNFKKT